MAEIYHVSPFEVAAPGSLHAKDVSRQMLRLESEGQIEPILCFKNSRGVWQVDQQNGWVYAREQIMAARQLNWETILITDDDNSS